MKPQSLLTRRLFRALLFNRPYHTPGCPRVSGTRRRPKPPTIPLAPTRRRSIFGLGFGSTREAFENVRQNTQNVERALVKLSDLVAARHSHSRQPSDHEVIGAFKFLFNARAGEPQPFTLTDVAIATQAFHYIRDQNLVLNETQPRYLESDDLCNILVALTATGKQEVFRPDKRELAAMVYQCSQKAPADESQTSQGTALKEAILPLYVKLLASIGSAQDAVPLFQDLQHIPQLDIVPLWLDLLRGLIQEDCSSLFWQQLEQMRIVIGPLSPFFQQELTTQFAKGGKTEDTKRIFAYPLQEGELPTNDCLATMLQFCQRTAEIDLGKSCAGALEKRQNIGEAIGPLLVWYAFESNGSVDIRAKLSHLLQQGVVDVLEMSAFNQLIRYAYVAADHNLAQEYIACAETFGLSPDATTYALQLNHEVSIEDLAAARTSFDALCVQDLPADRSDLYALNRYLIVLCRQRDPDYQLIMRVIDRITENNGSFDIEALASLVQVLLRKNELRQIRDLLDARIDAMAASDHALLSSIFIHHISDRTVPAEKAFQAYELFRRAFPETRPADRLPLMRSFFDRQRSDLACLVFGHMRQSEHTALRPDEGAYAECFYGIAGCKDIDGLQMVYNMLKLDLEVEQTTKVHNSMIAAYAACQTSFKAITDHYWKILDSRAGPTFSTFALALRACETWIGPGAQEARKIMALVQNLNLVITKQLYDCYIGALAGQCEFENVVELIVHMEEDIGEAPDATTIGTFYNAIPWQYRKDEVEKWAKRAYPELWRALEKYGDEIDEEWEVRYFKIDRSIETDDELLFAPAEYEPRMVSSEAPASASIAGPNPSVGGG